MNVNFRQLRYICTVAEHRNITKAAKALYISQPSLSNFIAKTEEALGVRLFERSTSAPLALTYAGERFVEHAQRILSQENSMLKELWDISGNITGRVRVGFPHERLAYMLPLMLPKYKAFYSHIDLQVSTANGSNLIRSVLKGQTDFAILPHHERTADTDTMDIYEEELFLVAREGTIAPEQRRAGCAEYAEPAENHETADIGTLENLGFIVLKEGHVIRSFVDNLFAAHKIDPPIALETNSNLASYRLAASGIGVAIVPGITLKLARIEEAARVYALSPAPVTWKIRAVFRRDAYIGEAEKAFIRIAKEVFTEGQG